jgi:hypothetical protein
MDALDDWLALRVAAATSAGPSGSGRMFILSVFAEMSRTFMAYPEPTTAGATPGSNACSETEGTRSMP